MPSSLSAAVARVYSISVELILTQSTLIEASLAIVATRLSQTRCVVTEAETGIAVGG